MSLVLRYRFWRIRRRWQQWWDNDALVMWAEGLNK